jgi:hypothetical protein
MVATSMRLKNLVEVMNSAPEIVGEFLVWVVQYSLKCGYNLNEVDNPVHYAQNKVIQFFDKIASKPSRLYRTSLMLST